jgi:multiple sugar transport system permease protein
LNKKLTNILRTNVTLYFICLVLFALAAIPIIVVFIAFQKYFTQGIAMGAVKG